MLVLQTLCVLIQLVPGNVGTEQSQQFRYQGIDTGPTKEMLAIIQALQQIPTLPPPPAYLLAEDLPALEPPSVPISLRAMIGRMDLIRTLPPPTVIADHFGRFRRSSAVAIRMGTDLVEITGDRVGWFMRRRAISGYRLLGHRDLVMFVRNKELHFRLKSECDRLVLERYLGLASPPMPERCPAG